MSHAHVRLVLPAQASPRLGPVALLDVDHQPVSVVGRQHHQHVVELPAETPGLLVEVDRVDHLVVHQLGLPQQVFHPWMRCAGEGLEHEPELPPAFAATAEAVGFAQRPRVDRASDWSCDRHAGRAAGSEALDLPAGLAQLGLGGLGPLSLLLQRLLMLLQRSDHLGVLNLHV